MSLYIQAPRTNKRERSNDGIVSQRQRLSPQHGALSDRLFLPCSTAEGSPGLSTRGNIQIASANADANLDCGAALELVRLFDARASGSRLACTLCPSVDQSGVIQRGAVLRGCRFAELHEAEPIF